MDKSRMDLIARLSRNSIMAVFEAASKMLDDDRDMHMEMMDSREAYQEDLTMDDIDKEIDGEEENWEGMPMCEGFDAFSEDPDDYLQGKEIGIPRNQLLVSSPMQGMLKPSPHAPMFKIEE